MKKIYLFLALAIAVAINANAEWNLQLKTWGSGGKGDSGYFRLAGACHEYSVASLNMKNFTSPTPRNCVRKALIFALNDSAEALVSLSSK